MKFNHKFLSGRNHLPHKNNISEFTVFRFGLVLFIINPSLEVQKLIVFFFGLKAFIFTVKNIFAA